MMTSSGEGLEGGADWTEEADSSSSSDSERVVIFLKPKILWSELNEHVLDVGGCLTRRPSKELVRDSLPFLTVGFDHCMRNVVPIYSYLYHILIVFDWLFRLHV